MGVRLEQKEQTRERIIDKTTQLVQENGFVGISTKDISKNSDVSQGTIFLHFKTKINLLNTILYSNVDNFEKDLIEQCNANQSTDNFVRNFLDAISLYEGILSRAYKDYSYLDDPLQKQLDDLDTLIKNKFYDNIKHNRSTNLNIVDTFTLIDAFISQIKQYLLEKNVYTKANSIIRQRRGRITKLYRMLFGEES
ncbi:TetR/AcrR family transcriptional regulator [Candidatus Xianfuyuplasma coldseepsis]|uniref:TetR/AcrR family transcriptional regulator n=1 Tax=Candidatus Xianfuyuplasma coldseepsis TaxID=2782163 RepID=A0A7L7KSH9_9MOLU|nr:TetR/AcrR family transcriptional regulator [Xianfuyuplasma coldseepsis]QMS84738.1 TetR/AcrR family transcriptional regulator [Xianfuyuplasma coldseepsis]